jgi:hypothetical protein
MVESMGEMRACEWVGSWGEKKAAGTAEWRVVEKAAHWAGH